MSTIKEFRDRYHATLCERAFGLRGSSLVPNIADSSQQASVDIAQGLLDRLTSSAKELDLAPQTLGRLFTEITEDFLRDVFGRLGHLRPGDWRFASSMSGLGIARFAQYAHLAEIQELIDARPRLKASLGGDYLVVPDIVVFRDPISDAEINRPATLIKPGDGIAARTPLRGGNIDGSPPILLASISMKWTMRSDRSQNTRTEALNLQRNRKGSTPQIVVVTMEPLPSRIASIAMGTGDVDCTYHAALDELLASARTSGRADQLEMLEMLIDGRRLRDISDLPFDLAS